MSVKITYLIIVIECMENINCWTIIQIYNNIVE
jgi:hypothetical protein